MRFGFVTCVELGFACMRSLYSVGGQLHLAVTLKDTLSPRKSGRVYIEPFCATHGIPLLKVNNVNDPEVASYVSSFGIDWLFVIGWSQIVRVDLLRIPKCGVLGMHPTLLPEGRGRAAIPWAIIKGLTKTGVSMFKLDAGVDTGPLLGQTEIPILDTEDAASLYAKVALGHSALIKAMWPRLLQRDVVFSPQDESLATEWSGREPKDGKIVSGMDCVTTDRLVRGTTRPYPGAFFEIHGTDYTIWQGKALPGMQLAEGYIDHAGTIWIPLVDGVFHGTLADKR